MNAIIKNLVLCFCIGEFINTFGISSIGKIFMKCIPITCFRQEKQQFCKIDADICLWQPCTYKTTMKIIELNINLCMCYNINLVVNVFLHCSFFPD